MSLALTVLLMPKLEYLPEGNRNMAFGSVRPPPGYNIVTTMAVAEWIEAAVRPLWARDHGRDPVPGQPPKIENFSFNAYDSGYMEITATAVDQTRIAELIPVMRAPIFDEPGAYGFMSQPSLFGRRAITLQLRPPTSVAMQAAIERLQDKVVAPTLREGLPDGVRIDISGVASRLAATWTKMTWQLLIAAVVVYLIMAALFESLLYPLIIMATLPMASAGALVCLGILNLFVYTPLDMLTVLGFVILIGIVVNNAILLVHQSLYLVRTEGLPMATAVATATQSRIRPVFMSTLTSLFGMAPLVLFPGAGTELYRGLGAVVLGGLTLSTFLTLLAIPALLCLVSPQAKRSRDKKSI